MDIHGKLCHLDAIDMSNLSLARRYALITMSGPWISDDYGRFTTSPGAHPLLPALTEREALLAVGSLIENRYLKTWNVGGKTCWEVAGAYGFKPGLKAALNARRLIAIRKRKENATRRERKKAARNGFPFEPDDDGKAMAADADVVDLIRTQRGNLIPVRKGMWYRSTVPVPKGQPRDKMLVKQPDDAVGCNLRMLPSFNPNEGLGALGTVLRYYLLLDSDDYGRVRLDVPQLYRQLGTVITKRIGQREIKAELAIMERSGYLLVFRKNSGTFAYIRDSAQHMKKSKRYDRTLPKMREDREFTFDSDAYTAFFKACGEHAASRDTVQVGEFIKHGDVHVVREDVGSAAKRFITEHNELMRTPPYSQMLPEEFCEVGDFQLSGRHFDSRNRFWHAIASNLPPEQVGQIYLDYKDEFDGTGSANSDTHKLFKRLLRMTPQAYVEQIKRGGTDAS